MTMGESAKFLANSPYIRDLATVVIGYGMAINIVEVTWKSKLKSAFPDPNSYSMFMGNFSTMTGIVTLLMMLAGRIIFKQFGWGVAALITPITLLTTGIAFFSLTLFPAFFAPITAKLGTTPLMLAVMIGAIQNILSKGNYYQYLSYIAYITIIFVIIIINNLIIITAIILITIILVIITIKDNHHLFYYLIYQVQSIHYLTLAKKWRTFPLTLNQKRKVCLLFIIPQYLITVVIIFNDDTHVIE